MVILGGFFIFGTKNAYKLDVAIEILWVFAFPGFPLRGNDRKVNGNDRSGKGNDSDSVEMREVGDEICMRRKYNLFCLRKELAGLYSAWKEYLKWPFLKFTGRKKVSSIMIFFIVFFLGGLFLALKVFTRLEPAYGQAGLLVEDAGFWLSLSKGFYWITGGSLLGVIVRLARRNYCRVKRAKDLLVSIVGLIVFSPLFAILAILVKVDSAGSVFFNQERVGEKGKIFKMWKFRTMRDNAELETGPVWANDDDPRVTKLGRFLRKSHLDEIPQLINIFKGEMSLIGPRPERPELVEIIKKDVPDFNNRLAVKPGIAGLAQSRYRYGASIKDAARKLKYDMIYIKKMCLLLDIKILFWTTGRVLTGEGAR